MCIDWFNGLDLIISDGLQCWLSDQQCCGKVAWIPESFGPLECISAYHKVSHTTSINNHFLHHGCGKNVTLFMRLWWWDFVLTGELSGVLLGDRGYACQPFLLTPFTDPQGAQRAYNHAHARTRARIEMTFGLLKARFQCLHHLRVSPDRACDITVACAVLHNVACLRKERAPRVPSQVDWNNPAIFPDDNSGRLLRDQYVLNYFL